MSWIRLCAGLLAIAVVSTPLEAAVYTITTTDEDTAVNGNCTLREALLAAAESATHDECDGDPGADEIILPLTFSDVYELDDGPITLPGRELTVRGVSLLTTVDLGSNQRFLLATAGSDLEIENVTFLNGSVVGNGGTVAAVGSDLRMKRVQIESSSATRGGGVSFEATTPHTLDLEDVQIQSCEASAELAASGGAVYVDLDGGGTVRIVRSRLAFNKVTTTAESPTARGGALDLDAAGAVSIELRHLDVSGNEIHAETNSSGGGAAISIAGSGAVLAEDLEISGNLLFSQTELNDASALRLSITGPALELRRVRAMGNGFWAPLESPAVAIQIGTGTAATLSDLLLASNKGIGLELRADGASCSLLAGSLTVAGHHYDGITLYQAGCPLRLENSISWDNDFVGGGDSQITVVDGAPEVSKETADFVGTNPLFVDENFTQDFRLQAISPAIGAGDRTFASVGPYDVRHGRRVLGGEIDLGAFEYESLWVDDFESGDVFAWSDSTP